jgi:hypothetical protein
VTAQVDDADHVQGAAGEHARQAAPQAVPHCRLLLLLAGGWLLVLCFVGESGSAGGGGGARVLARSRLAHGETVMMKGVAWVGPACLVHI